MAEQEESSSISSAPTVACPRCGAMSEVVSTTRTAYGGIERRRKCGSSHLFTTLEVYPQVIRRKDAVDFTQTLKDRWFVWGRYEEMYALRAAGTKMDVIAHKFKMTVQAVAYGLKQRKALHNASVDHVNSRKPKRKTK